MVEQAFFSTEIRPQLTEPEVALWRSQHGPLASVPLRSQQIGPPDSIHNQSGCCSAEDCTSLYPTLPAVAVAVYSTPMAIIVQRAEKLGSWEDQVSQWRKLQRKFAGKAEAESQPTSWSETWTFHQWQLAMQGWKSWLTASACSTGRSWPLTQLLCLR